MPFVVALVLALAGAAGVDGTTLHRRGSPTVCAGIKVSAPNLTETPRDHVMSPNREPDPSTKRAH